MERGVNRRSHVMRGWRGNDSCGTRLVEAVPTTLFRQSGRYSFDQESKTYRPLCSACLDRGLSTVSIRSRSRIEPFVSIYLARIRYSFDQASKPYRALCLYLSRQGSVQLGTGVSQDLYPRVYRSSNI